MLAPTSDYGYTPSPSMGYDLHHLHSGERPKLFVQPPNPTGVDAYGHMLVHHTTPHQHHTLTPQHALSQQQALTPQHALTESEPLLMNVQGPSGHGYYPPPQMGHQMLHVSSNYEYASHGNGGVVTPSSSRSHHSGSKRSREDLNLKEKKRMFKLNDRINQLKDMLDEAGVQTKKNKQSILDNAAHYIEMLRSNLLIAKQKAERAEKQTEVFRLQQSTCSADKVVRGVFQKSTTPRVVMDLTLQPITFNKAFVTHTGLSEMALKRQKTLRPYLCADQDELESIVKIVCETNQSISTVVKTSVEGENDVSVNLVAAVVTDDAGKATNVEFSLIPIKTQQLETVTGLMRVKNEGARDEAEEMSGAESLTDGEPSDDNPRL
uniref:BHLH domain-containing protein n=1 Tax=Peronospora matthiolae TaxID=2874970 RepID=A0AAV1TPF7_9STRA